MVTWDARSAIKQHREMLKKDIFVQPFIGMIWRIFGIAAALAVTIALSGCIGTAGTSAISQSFATNEQQSTTDPQVINLTRVDYDDSVSLVSPEGEEINNSPERLAAVEEMRFKAVESLNTNFPNINDVVPGNSSHLNEQRKAAIRQELRKAAVANDPGDLQAQTDAGQNSIEKMKRLANSHVKEALKEIEN